MSTSEVTSSRVLTWPNAISAVRLLLVPVFAVLAFGRHDVAALAVLAISGASDWLDGVLARRLHQVSRLGELLDPAADRLFILVTLVVLAVRDVVPWWLLVVIVARDVLLAVVLLVLGRRGLGPLPVHFVGKGGTFALLYAFPLLFLAHGTSAVAQVAWVLGWAFSWWGVALYWLAAALYVWQAVGLLRVPRPAEVE